MRFKVGVLLSIVIVALYWWFWDSAPRTSSQTDLASTPSSPAPTETAEKPQSTTTTTETKAVRAVRSLGANPSKPPPFLSRRKPGRVAGTDKSPMERFKGLKMSDPLEMNGRRQMVLGARAVVKSEYRPYMGKILFEHDNYVVLEQDTNASVNWKNLVVRPSDRALVVNPNGRLGVVTGTLIVKLADKHKADVLAGRENLQLLHLDEAVGVAYFRAPENYELVVGAERLKKSPDVERVEIEIVQNKVGF